MASGSITPEALAETIQQTMSVTLLHLKTVARSEGLLVSGAKAILQDRIKNSPYSHSDPFQVFPRPGLIGLVLETLAANLHSRC